MTEQPTSASHGGPVQWRLTPAQRSFADAYDASPGALAPRSDGAVFLYHVGAECTDRWLVADDGFVLQHDRLGVLSSQLTPPGQ